MQALKATEESLRKAIASIRGPVENMKPLMNQVSAFILRCVFKNFDQAGRPDKWIPSRRAMETGGKTLLWRGLLRNSIRRMHDAGMAGVFTNDKRARIHQEGGIIKPVKAKMLAIPIHEESFGKWPGLFADTYIPKSGKVIMWKQPGGDIPIFALLKQVVMPARPYIRPTDSDLDELEPLISQWITQGRLA